MLGWFAALAIGLAALFFVGAAILQRATGLPPGLVVWDDERQQRGRFPEPLYDPESGLIGRPDYLLRRGRDWVPVELKSRPAPRAPYRGHKLQAAAYCLLVQAVLDKRPGMAILQYADRSFSIPYTLELEKEVRQVIARIHSCGARIPDRSHESPARCRACGFVDQCDQILA